MFVLGFDPGLSRCGYGAVRQENGEPVAVVSGVITTPTSNPLAERLAELLRELRLLLARLTPEVVVVERVLFQTNARTAMSVGQAERPRFGRLSRSRYPGRAVQPQRSQTGRHRLGQRGKAQVQRMVQVLLDLPEKPDSSRQGRRPRTGPLPPGERAHGASCSRRDLSLERDRKHYWGPTCRGQAVIGSLRGRCWTGHCGVTIRSSS